MWTLWNKICFIKNSFWKFYKVRSERGDFNSRPHGMYFDAVVVEVKTFLLFIRIGSGHTVAAETFCNVYELYERYIIEHYNIRMARFFVPILVIIELRLNFNKKKILPWPWASPTGYLFHNDLYSDSNLTFDWFSEYNWPFLI